MTTVQTLGLTCVVAFLTLIMGVLMVSGRWRSPLLKVYPGAGVGLVLISLAFILGVVAALIAPLWPVATMPMMGSAGVLAVAGFIVGSFGPKRLLPRWQREEIEKEKNAE